jgi:hypothetical protein
MQPLNRPVQERERERGGGEDEKPPQQAFTRMVTICQHICVIQTLIPTPCNTALHLVARKSSRAPLSKHFLYLLLFFLKLDKEQPVKSCRYNHLWTRKLTIANCHKSSYIYLNSNLMEVLNNAVNVQNVSQVTQVLLWIMIPSTLTPTCCPVCLAIYEGYEFTLWASIPSEKNWQGTIQTHNFGLHNSCINIHKHPPSHNPRYMHRRPAPYRCAT